MQYFCSNNVEGVAESWVEAEMSWVEVDGAGWSWVEVDGAGGWRSVNDLVIPVIIYCYNRKFTISNYYLLLINLKNIIENYYWLIKIFTVNEYN